MNRIQEIQNHIKLADESEATASEHNWAASRLIWEEVEAGTSQKDIAAAIGKSGTHVSFMKRCWQWVVDQGHDGLPPAELGSFYKVYNSAEIRGDSAAEREPGGRDREPGDRRPLPPGPDDNSGHGIVVHVANLLDTLERNPAYWPTLTEDDATVLRESREAIDAILAGIQSR